MDKELELEKEIEADYTGFSEEESDKAVDKHPKRPNNVPVTLFSSKNKKPTTAKKVVVFE